MNIYYISGIVTIVFILIKIIEKKIILKEDYLNIKENIKDGIIIFLVIIAVFYIYNNYLLDTIIDESPKVFLNNPDF